MRNNKGIIATGSATINAGAMAAGDHAHAENTGVASAGVAAPDVAALRAEVRQLVGQLRAAGAELPDGDQLVETAEQVDAELARERPNKHTLLGLCGGVAAGVTSVAALAEAAEKIRQAVAALF